ncbi:hypothetical protein BT93_B1712 [Corymbia citriodora subsp. variegata]|nr:hypothetical protein BT93_B1712 [Corymbia citriodora subsp. variegata]KAF8039248.1 hypothetical protein BT93_B1712 [Corymbia citriodora subsp. variegata]
MTYGFRRRQHWEERQGPYRAPASVVWRYREGLDSRSRETIADQIGRHQHWQERDDPSHVPASVVRRYREGINLRSPETIAYQIDRKRHWQERDDPSHIPASVAWRFREGINSWSPETAYQIGRKRHWQERDDPSHVPASVAWRFREDLNLRSAETIAHRIGRNQHYWKERDGPHCVPALVARQFRKGLNLRSPKCIAHQIRRNRHWEERHGPSHIPASVAWRFRKGLNSRLPKTIPHWIGRNRHWQERDGPSRVPALVAWRFRKGLNSRLPETIAHQIRRNQHQKERNGLSRVPASFGRDLNLKSPKPIFHQSGRIEYAGKAISEWLAVGLDNDGDHLPSSVFLRPVLVEAIEWQPGEKPLTLAKSSLVNGDDETGQDHRKKPWVHIAETVMQDLVCSFNALKSEIKDQSMDGIKPTLIARFGKIIFRGTPSFPVETRGDMVTKASLKRLKKIFYSNLPSVYMENVTHKVIPEIGLSFEDEKDIYHVKLSDKSRPGATICCKCSVVKAEQRLELYKENEKDSIRDMISSAVLDSSVKGGLRWPPRKAFAGDRYRVVGAWHTISRTYNNSSMRLKVKHADRFDFRDSHGKIAEEITLKLNGINSELHGQNLGADSVCEMLKDAVKMMWEHFLSCGSMVI